MENKLKIAKHNAKYEQGLVTYKLGVNKYADMVGVLSYIKTKTVDKKISNFHLFYFSFTTNL